MSYLEAGVSQDSRNAKRRFLTVRDRFDPRGAEIRDLSRFSAALSGVKCGKVHIQQT